MAGISSPVDAAWLVLRVVFDPLNILVSAAIAIGATWVLWGFYKDRRKG